ncbi:MAG TPA: ATP-binding protein [Pyrinomonadaceae bacterium]|nr:ATP-binding protein [Pyrinomonadaceae bacterium]
MREIRSIEVRDEAQVGMARRAVHDYARRVGFSETELAQIDIVVQEIGTNTARHTTEGGWIHFTTPLGSAQGLELFYWDKGPGIYNLDRAVRDGVTTSGSLGAGLGAIRRLMDEFDVYSTVAAAERLSLASARRTSHGTALLARKWLGDGGDRAEACEAKRYGVWSRPHPSETVNGDAYFMRTHEGRTMLAVVDGLGHGSGAKEAADVALDSLDEWVDEPLDEVLLAVHDALRATRGAVIGAAIIDRAGGHLHCAGVGNVALRVFDAPEPVTVIPVNGTLGVRLGSMRVWTHPWAEGATIVITSDGISESWDVASYPGLLRRSPQLLAGILMRDYGRDADDATVLVAK